MLHSLNFRNYLIRNSMRVDKTKWKKGTFNDVCTIIHGKDHKSVNDPNGQYPIYGSGGIMGKANQYLCEPGTTIVGRKGTINSPIFVNKRFWNIDTAFGLFPKKMYCDKFIFYFCKNFDFKKIQSGAAIPSLTRKDILKQSFVIPTLSEQEGISAELDAVQTIIDGYKVQIADLDQLAKSIFLGTFGDPISNDKGWNLSTLVQISENNGVYGASSASTQKENNRPRYIRITDIDDSGNLNGDFVVSSNVVDDNTYLLKYGDILFARTGATVGKTYLYKCEEPQIYAGYLIKFSLNIDIVEPQFIFYITKSNSYKTWVKNQIIGAAQPNVNAKRYSALPIILPSHSLQQQFASQVEAIEKQKELLREQLQDAEQLMAERMQYYFS